MNLRYFYYKCNSRQTLERHNHFDLELLDIIKLTTTNILIRKLILNSSIRINNITTYSPHMRIRGYDSYQALGLIIRI